MVSFPKKVLIGEKIYGEGVCLSGDTKPTTGIVNGTVLVEMDTGTVYFFDEAGGQWKEFE